MSTAAKTRYKNPWHKPGKPEYGPDFYETDAKAIEYRGYLIYRRQPNVFDVVKDGVCVTAMAGPNGARDYVDRAVGDEKTFQSRQVS